MTILRKPIFILFLLLYFVFPARATHIVGGEIGYRCLGNNQYEITLTVYRDCYYGSPQALFDDPASIGIFVDTSNFVQFELKIPATDQDTLEYELADPCLSVPPDVCVEVMQYVDTIMLPYNSYGYTLVYQRCCRNQTLLNIHDPLDTGASFVTEMTAESMTRCNSSPVFNDWPPIALCVNQPLDFDHSASDVDGDSIVYSLCTPYLGATPDVPMPQPPLFPIQQEVNWIDPPYNTNNMLGGVPLTIDAQSGKLTAIPNTIGQFVVGVCMQEYRNGLLLSEVKRDFQFNVSDCGQVVSSFFVPELSCDDLTLDFNNLSLNASGYFWDFGEPGIDSDTSVVPNPTYSYTDTGTYVVTLIAQLSETCVDTFVKNVNLQRTTFDVGVDWDVLGCDDSLAVRVQDMTVDSVFEIVQWDWTLSNAQASIQSDSMNPYFVIPSAPNTILHGTITSSNGCEKEVIFPFPYQLIPDLPNTQLHVCKGDDVSLNPDFVDTIDYVWAPAQGLDNPYSGNPTLENVQDDALYQATLTGQDSVCSRSFDVSVIVAENMVFAQADPDTIFEGESSQLQATGDGHLFHWRPASSLNFDTIQNPIASPTETTEYWVVSTDEYGCLDSVSVRLVVLNPTCDLPNVFVPTGFTPNNDGQNDEFKVYGFIVESMVMMVFDRWGEKVFESHNQNDGWDGRYKGVDLPPDVYGFYVKVKCINGEEYVRQGHLSLIR